MGTVVIMIQTLLGLKKILPAKVVYIPNLYVNLAYLKKFNDKNIWWDNKKNLLYKNNHEMFPYCERHCN